MITRAYEADVDQIIPLIYRFNNQYFGVPLNRNKLRKWYYTHMMTGVVFRGNNSVISGLVIEDPVRDHKVLAETAWYAEDRDGIRLLKRFINHGRMLGVDEVRMTTLNTTPAGAETLLKRMGFETIEKSHRLTL